MNILSKIPSSMMGVTIVMAALAPVVMIAAAQNPALMVLWMGIYISVGVVAALGSYFFERSKKNKSKDFSKGVEQNAGSAEGVKDPNKIAQIDHMRKEFQKGIDIYKKYGKDLYSLPWYVVVGEAGSGKTEAVRRSEIGFPDKLQDKWQGSGGTLSMHWWFTNKAVILDTAGRLFVQDGSDSDGTQSQWVSFLQMLKKNRPDCPINGLMLVIPATRLMAHEDSEAEAASLARIDQNAGQISRQLEILQAELGIRFPVYIMVSKTDKITGFREFFQGVDTADERYQMLGWSNPAPLGESFNPQSVAEYMKSVADRLKRRMMSELRNPEPAAMSDLRIDEVDSLYSFPTAFASMAPKLQRYLRQVFSSDEWSSKPPFLRGIYFSSALQQGRVLDEAVAKALGIPLEQMENAEEEDGLRLSKNRTYFMRDLFLDKIFREKGLVTRSDKVRSSISGWKLWLPACFVMGLLLLALLGWLTAKSGREAQAWAKLWSSEEGQSGRRIAPLIEAETWGGAEVFTALDQLGADVQGRPKFGWVFAPAQLFDRNLSKQRRELYGDVVAEGFGEMIGQVTVRLAEAAERSTGLRETEWKALRALLILHHAEMMEGGRMVFPTRVEGDPEVPVREVLADLTGFLELGNDERSDQLARIVERAATVKDADFKRKLESGLDPAALAVIMQKAFPQETPLQADDFVREMDQFAVDFDRAIGLFWEVKPNPEAAEQAKALRTNAADLLARYRAEIAIFGSEPAGDAAEDASEMDGKTLVSELVARQDSLRATYPQFSQKRKATLSRRSRALVDKNGAILKGIVSALSPDGGDGFSGDEADALLVELNQAAKEDNEDAKNIGKLRDWWLKHDFYPNRFPGYLRFPLVKDGKSGSASELYLLLRLVQVLEAVGVDEPELSSLSEAANAVFDLTKLRRDVDAVVRKARIRPRGQVLESVRVEVLDGDENRLGEFDTRIGNLKPLEVPLNKALVFRVEGLRLVDPNPSWSILRWRFTSEVQGWIKNVRHTDGRGLTLEVSMPEDVPIPDPAEWPSMKDFEKPE